MDRNFPTNQYGCLGNTKGRTRAKCEKMLHCHTHPKPSTLLSPMFATLNLGNVTAFTKPRRICRMAAGKLMWVKLVKPALQIKWLMYGYLNNARL
jgi:hypothetical protein